MKALGFIIFFTVFFIIYGSVNYYIFVRGLACTPEKTIFRKLYVLVFLFVALSFILARVLEGHYGNPVIDIMHYVGSYWFAYMLYLFLFIVLIDYVRLINYFIPFYPKFITNNYSQAKLYLGLGVLVIVSVVVLLGHLNAKKPRVVYCNIDIDKTSPIKQLKIAYASDIHLGKIIKNSQLQHMVDMMNDLQPDIVLFGGDVVDEDLAPVIRHNLGEHLRELKSKYGTYAITGNHEFIGGYKAACKYLEEHNVKMVCDSVMKIDDAFYISGRYDKSFNRMTGDNRKSVETLLENVDSSLPIILMDHEPSSIAEIAASEVDLSLSGHTHHGQLWPLGFVTSKIFKISWGYKLIENTHFYVSCGFGTWGPPVRTGNKPEIVEIILNFKGAK